MPHQFTESIVEDAALAWLEILGYTVKHGPEIAGKLRSDGGERVRASVRAKNALAQILGNMQKMHFAFKPPADRLI